MAKYNFGNYTRNITNTSSHTDVLEYDSDYFNNLLNNREYDKAVEYASQFTMTDENGNIDVIKQRARESYLYDLEREGRKMSAIFSNIYDEDEKNAVDFYLNVFSDGGLEKLNSNNKYGNEFANLKNKLGGENSSKLAITFAPEKRKFLGIDWLAKDNDNNIDNFYSNTGLSEDILREAGINIKQKDGYTTLEFDKSNKYANYIISNLNPSTVHNRNLNNDYSFEIGINLVGLDDNNNIVTPELVGYATMNRIGKLIRNSKEISERFIKPLQIDKVYSSTVGGFIEDGLEELREQRDRGEIKQSDYKQLVEERYKDITSVLKNIGSGGYRIYTDMYNGTENETMQELGNQDKHWAIEEISSAEDFSLNTMISNGEIGTLITIYGVPEDKKNINMDDSSEESIKRPRHSFFIPGLFHDKAQAAINADSRTRADQELNEMQDWGYTIKLKDGSQLSHKGGNIFKYNGKDIRIDQARTIINKDFIIEDAMKTIKYQFTDANGKINKPLADAFVKKVVYNAVNELYPSIPFRTINFQDFGIEELFAMRSLGNNVEETYKSLVNYDVYQKMLEAYNMYGLLMDDINKYINNER